MGHGKPSAGRKLGSGRGTWPWCFSPSQTSTYHNRDAGFCSGATATLGLIALRPSFSRTFDVPPATSLAWPQPHPLKASCNGHRGAHTAFLEGDENVLLR